MLLSTSMSNLFSHFVYKDRSKSFYFAESRRVSNEAVEAFIFVINFIKIWIFI